MVPGGVGWNIETVEVAGEYFNGPGPANSVNVNFYSNGGNNRPGSLLQSRPNQTFTNGPSFSIPLNPIVSLGAGTYWVSVQANQNLIPQGQWGWRDRSVLSNTNASWQNPGNGFGTGCTTWGARATCIGGPDAGAPDQVYRLRGTVGRPASAAAASAAAASTSASACSNAGGITINDAGPATPYPSTCVASGLSGAISDVDVTFTSLDHTWPDDVDMLLVSPDGQNATIMSDAGGSNDLIDCTLTLDDRGSGCAARLRSDRLPRQLYAGGLRGRRSVPGPGSDAERERQPVDVQRRDHERDLVAVHR